ncbi:hypothetical protein CHS0354_019422 [Potamilus streckersoni]|uniref:Uncharacterized protein n=1 Tax=Potamilus streckersoni TaxID=2493646 RepID=A0AAE0SHQ6_9BIVA|nr:hypothetical protein CHS0354_019422 [Potamilus streckersoni]
MNLISKFTFLHIRIILHSEMMTENLASGDRDDMCDCSVEQHYATLSAIAPYKINEYVRTMKGVYYCVLETRYFVPGTCPDLPSQYPLANHGQRCIRLTIVNSFSDKSWSTLLPTIHGQSCFRSIMVNPASGQSRTNYFRPTIVNAFSSILLSTMLSANYVNAASWQPKSTLLTLIIITNITASTQQELFATKLLALHYSQFGTHYMRQKRLLLIKEWRAFIKLDTNYTATCSWILVKMVKYYEQASSMLCCLAVNLLSDKCR